MPPERKHSGYYYPNKFARITLEAMEDVMGRKWIKSDFESGRGCRISWAITRRITWEKEFDFADFTALNIALEEMYGPRGGRGLRCVPDVRPLHRVCVRSVRWLAWVTWHSKCCPSMPS